MSSTPPVKILHLTTHLNIGGIGRYIEMVAGRFVRMGYEVSVLSGGGQLESVLEQKGVRCHRLGIKTKSELSPRLWWNLPAAVRLVRKEKFDLIHAHTRVAQVLAAVLWRLTGVPVVSTAHGFYRPKLGRRLFPLWGRRVIAISPLVAEELQTKHRLPKSKIRLVENAVDIEELETLLLQADPATLRRRLGLADDAQVLCCISRLVKDKGQQVLIRALKEVRRTHPRACLLLVGDGREKKNIEKLIRKLGLTKHCFLLASYQPVTDLLAASDIYVHPATYREGFGLSMVEAMVAKKPVIASDIWAINTIIRHHVNGFLVGPSDVKELAQMIVYVLDHPAEAESVAFNGYDAATRLYAIDRLVTELETVYQEVLR